MPIYFFNFKMLTKLKLYLIVFYIPPQLILKAHFEVLHGFCGVFYYNVSFHY